MNKKVSFDFDDTLSSGIVQTLAEMFIKDNFDVWVVTSRLSDERIMQAHNVKETNWNNDLYAVVNQLDIPRENIVFTSYYPKYEFFWEENDDFLFHLDDDIDEVNWINKMTNVEAIHFPYGNFKKREEIVLELKNKYLV